jgi:hypothetical protein
VTENLVNTYEEDVKFTREDLVKLFDDFYTQPKYKSLLSDPEKRFNLWVSEKGTEYNTELPSFKTEYYFDSKFLICEVANCLHDLL